MNEVKFWELVQSAHEQSGGDMDQKCELIRAAVAGLSKGDAVAFSRIFDAMMIKAYAWPLWGAAYVINGGCSDDSFIDFRASLISRGRKKFDSAMDDPDSLATEEFDEESWFYEGYQYAVFDGVESAAGSVPDRAPYPTAPSGKEWSEDDVDALFPLLSQKFA